MNFGARNFGAKKDANEGGNRVAAGNFLHTSPAGCREGSNNDEYFQNSNIVDKSTQSQNCSVSGTQGRQAAEVRFEGT